jgi:hypothetical protein
MLQQPSATVSPCCPHTVHAHALHEPHSQARWGPPGGACLAALGIAPKGTIMERVTAILNAGRLLFNKACGPSAHRSSLGPF